MKRTLFITALLLLITAGFIYTRLNTSGNHHVNEGKEVATVDNKLKNADIIFQTSLSAQSKAIQVATKSKYSHCGIIFQMNGKYYVFEAVQPVKITPLKQWINRGKSGEYVIKRLKNSDKMLTPDVLNKMRQIGETFLGKNYDLAFEWSDDKMYCSELIWKIYYRATGIELGKPEKLRDFDLTDPMVKFKLKERYGEAIPLDETVISPKAIFDSKHLIMVNKINP